MEQILQLDCLATDFYRNPAFPTFLYYNPYNEDKAIEYFNEGESVDLFDAISHRIVASQVTGKGNFTLPAGQTMLIVVIPAMSKLKNINGKTMLNDVVIAYK